MGISGIKKKGLFFGILLLAVIIAGIVILSAGVSSMTPDDMSSIEEQTAAVPSVESSNVLGRASYNVVLDKALPDATEKILVYKVVPQHYTKEDSIALAEKFNMGDIGITKEVDEGSSIASEDGTIYAVLKNSGSIEYTNSNRAHTINPYDVPENLPSDEEAIKIATEFLKERDLLPEGAVCTGTEHNKIYRLVRDGDDIVVWEDVEVWYGRMLNGLKVKGSKISIGVGGGGDILDFYSNWRTYEPYKELPVKSPEQAFEELKNKGVSVGTNKQDSVVSIDEMYMAYHSLPGAYTEEYLEPVWVFGGNVMVDGKSVMEVQEYIPALTDNAVKGLSSV